MTTEANFTVTTWRDGPLQGMARFWTVLDVTFAVLLIAASANAMSRFGLGGLVWAAVYGLFALRIALVWRAFASKAPSFAIFFAYPAICLASTLWSPIPTATFIAACQLACTCLFAAFLGWRFGVAALIRIVFLLTSAMLALSLLQYFTHVLGQPVYAAGGEFLGLFTHKNMLGQVAAMNLLGAAIVLASGARARLFAAAQLPLAAAMLWLSGSVSALGVAVASVVVFFLLMETRSGRSTRPLWIFGLIVAIGFAPLIATLLGQELIDGFFQVTGKTRTMTGRTVLWEAGAHIAANNWLAGVGFMAFWQANAFAAARSFILVEDVSSFHNVVLNVWVGTGVTGVCALCAIMFAGVKNGLRLFRKTQSAEHAGAVVLMLLLISISMFTTNFFKQHELALALFIALSVAAKAGSRQSAAVLGGYALWSTKRAYGV